jgi:hypothetical protein
MGNLDGKPGCSINHYHLLLSQLQNGCEFTHIMRIEALHLLSVAGEDKNHLAIEVLDLWQKVIQDGASAKVIPGRQLVGFVDEEDAAAII